MTLSLTNTSILEIIRYISHLSGAVGDIRPDGIWVVPISEGLKPLITHSYIIPQVICATKAQAAEMTKGLTIGLYASGRANFDEKTHCLTLQMIPGDYGAFDRWYAGQLFGHGFKVGED